MSVPSHFGRYRVLRPLASGEMGVVYLAEDPLIGRQVAIKSIRFDPYVEDEELQRLQQRFDQEIQIAGTFSHPNIVTLFDVGRQDSRSFIAMEYVDGRNLRAELQATGPMTTEQAINVAVPLCRALSYAHERGVIHRDIKPTNILMSTDGTPKVTDFGVARLFGSTLTNAGKIFGTPAYMSPEQAVGGNLDGASDQFAVATVLYELVAGERPFKGSTPTAVIYEVIENNPAPPHEIAPLLPTAVSAAIMRGLEKNPKDRYESCDAFADALKEALAWSKANPELAYLDGKVPRDPTLETGVNWGAVIAHVRQRTKALAENIRDAGYEERIRDAARYLVERPRMVTTFAGGAFGLAFLLAAVTWANSVGGLVVELPNERVNPNLVNGAAPAAPALPDRKQGVSRGSDSHVLEAAAEEAEPEQHTEEQVKPETEATTRTFVVSSRPVGASVRLDGELLGEASPITLELREGQRYRLRLEKEGFEPAGWAFTLDELSDAHRESGQLFFPLTAIAEPVVEEQISAPAGAPTISLTAETTGPPREEPAAEVASGVSGPPPSPTNVRRVRAPADAPRPEKLRHVDPSLPAGDPLEGVVVMEIEVSARGNVVQAKVLRGVGPTADQAALAAVVRWKYEPTTVGGTPVHVILTVTLPVSRS